MLGVLYLAVLLWLQHGGSPWGLAHWDGFLLREKAPVDNSPSTDTLLLQTSPPTITLAPHVADQRSG